MGTCEKILNYSSDLPLNLPHLTVLNLSHNKISKIPDSLFGFIHLRLLDLSFNKIDNVPSTISLFHDLRKLDLSHNEISKIPSSISNLKRLEKLNVSHNKLEHLPLSLGNMPSLQVVLATANPLQQGLQEGWEEAGSGPLLAFLRRCYAGSVPALPADHISLGNAWSRVRGPVFDSSVLNSGSAQSLFEQMQAQAVNTGNRLLTPLIPPVKATKLPVDKLRDSILGLFYGAAIGDSLGERVVVYLQTINAVDIVRRADGRDDCGRGRVPLLPEAAGPDAPLPRPGQERGCGGGREPGRGARPRHARLRDDLGRGRGRAGLRREARHLVSHSSDKHQPQYTRPYVAWVSHLDCCSVGILMKVHGAQRPSDL